MGPTGQKMFPTSAMETARRIPVVRPWLQPRREQSTNESVATARRPTCGFVDSIGRSPRGTELFLLGNMRESLRPHATTRVVPVVTSPVCRGAKNAKKRREFFGKTGPFRSRASIGAMPFGWSAANLRGHRATVARGSASMGLTAIGTPRRHRTDAAPLQASSALPEARLGEPISASVRQKLGNR